MRNDIVYKIVGICNIHMRMFDGQVRTLTNVRHVLDLTKNIFSLGAMEALGYKFSGPNGEIKVTRGSMMILKGEHTAKLCKLTGSIIVGDASATTEKEDTTSFGTCVLDT